MACGILVPRPEIKPEPSAVKVWSPNHWTSRRASLCGNIQGNMGPIKGFPSGSEGKETSAMQETQLQSLGWEDPLEKEMATHSSILAWRIPWTEEPGIGLQSMGSQRVGHD